MKKIAFIVIMSFLLLTISDTILAKTDTAKTDTDYGIALKYYNSGKYKEAVRLFQEHIKKKPDPSAYYRIGYALYELRKFSEANEYFKQAYLIDPNFSPKPAPKKEVAGEPQAQKPHEPLVIPEQKSAAPEPPKVEMDSL